MAPDPIIGQRTFPDGSTHDVYLDQAGRQDVQGDDGRSYYGTWLPPDPYHDGRPA